MIKSHSVMFALLTNNNPDNLSGLLSYALYKQDKEAFIREWMRGNPDESCPSFEELKNFEKISREKISQYLNEGQKRLDHLVPDLFQQKNTAREFNFIFKELTENNDNNILGLIAYGLYKNEKIAFIKQWKNNHPDKPAPSNEEINNFHNISTCKIASYKELAESRMRKFVDVLIANNVEAYRQAKKNAQKEATEELIDDQKKRFDGLAMELKKPWWIVYPSSGVVGNFAFLIFSTLILWLVSLIKSDVPTRLFEWLKGLLGF